MNKKFYTILTKSDPTDKWTDQEVEMTEDEANAFIRRNKQLDKRLGCGNIMYRKKCVYNGPVQFLTVRAPGTYILVNMAEGANWAGQKYIIFSTKENGNIAEVDIYPGLFRIFGYSTNGYEERKTKDGAINLAKRQVKEFFSRIGETRPIFFN